MNEPPQVSIPKMLELRAHLMSLGVDVEGKTDEECLEIATSMVVATMGSLQEGVEEKLTAIVKIFDDLAVALSDLFPLVEDVERERQHAKRDLANKRRTARGGKWKAF